MGKYGRTAIIAARHLSHGVDPAPAWELAAAEVFAEAPASRRKVCPREAFLGLAAAGLLPGSARSEIREAAGLNRSYAATAADLLARGGGAEAISPTRLWKMVLGSLGSDPAKRHNGQMDVVLALWREGLLDRAPRT